MGGIREGKEGRGEKEEKEWRWKFEAALQNPAYCTLMIVAVVARGQLLITVSQAFCCSFLRVVMAVNRRVPRTTYMSERRRRRRRSFSSQRNVGATFYVRD